MLLLAAATVLVAGALRPSSVKADAAGKRAGDAPPPPPPFAKPTDRE